MPRKRPETAVTSRLRDLRVAAGLSQADLAREVGLTRQAVISIETGRYVPNTAVALKMAQRLACRVEDLFALPEAEVPERVTVWDADATAGARVTLARVRGRLMAHALPPSRPLFEAFAGADAVLTGRAGSETAARLLVPRAELDRGALVLGCDPSLEIVAAHVARRLPGHRLTCVPATSRAALDAVAAGATHIAGSHLRGDDNVQHARRALAGVGGLVVALASWEQGLIVAKGNPRRIRSVQDLGQRGLRIVNRQPGAGSRAMLDELLTAAGMTPDLVGGYDREVPGHLAAAHAVACGGADAGLGIRAAACALDLDFVPLAHVRFDLVIPADQITHPVVAQALELLNGKALRDDLSSLPGYDVSRTGAVVAEVAARR